WLLGSSTSGGMAFGIPPISAVSHAVNPGELILAVCRGNSGTQPAVFTFDVSPPGLTSLSPVIRSYDPSSQYFNEFTYGVISSQTAPGTMITVTTGGFPSINDDCVLTVFSGGLAAPAVAAQIDTTGGAGGFVTCGPISSVPGGVVFYSANRST